MSSAGKSQTIRLSAVLALNLAMIAGLITVGVLSRSVGVLAAGGDYIADSAAIGLGLFAISLRDAKHPHPRATYIVALVNALFLLLITSFVIFESLRRLSTHTPAVEGLPVMLISIIATLVMLAGAHILGKSAGSEDLHMRSVLLDTLSDAASSGAVAITGGIIYFTRSYYWLDPAAALVISIVIGYGAVKLIKDVVKSLRLGPNPDPK